MYCYILYGFVSTIYGMKSKPAECSNAEEVCGVAYSPLMSAGSF